MFCENYSLWISQIDIVIVPFFANIFVHIVIFICSLFIYCTILLSCLLFVYIIVNYFVFYKSSAHFFIYRNVCFFSFITKDTLNRDV